ncbi:hypothetical protein T03_9156 [Trichinella britovi]|uniref:Uncharacterized protein n=1 Tax=Trichinella britovi TaxID=45882 RepID=A0A0V1CFX4_TRIBR|nr:hypothetical protein T03_9156 [Trichinella britovi]
MGLVRCEAPLYTGFRCSTASKRAISPTLGITGLDHQFQPGKLHLIEDMAQFNEVQDKSTGICVLQSSLLHTHQALNDIHGRPFGPAVFLLLYLMQEYGSKLWNVCHCRTPLTG